jgi:hypothetical protein
VNDRVHSGFAEVAGVELDELEGDGDFALGQINREPDTLVILAYGPQWEQLFLVDGWPNIKRLAPDLL